jgi:hypothetical protein
MNASTVLRIAAVVVFVLATVGVAPVPMTPLALALWCGSTLVPAESWTRRWRR